MTTRGAVGLALVLLSCRNEPKPSAPPAPSATTAVGDESSDAQHNAATERSAPANENSQSAPAAESTSTTAGGALGNSVAVYDRLPSCTGYYERSLKLYSWSQPQLRARFGPPTTTEAYRVVDRQGEFYAFVEGIYPTTDPKNLDVSIEEWTWVKGECRLTVWFHRPEETWRALGDLLWHYGDEF